MQQDRTGQAGLASGQPMDNAVSLSARTAPFDWRDLYLQALFETDRNCIRARIAEAKRALIRREHELFADPAGKAEKEAVTDALNALYALQTCLELEAAGAA